jgi:(1->4)-alpha-D-glucan 1-alpha-D-glucosylmutase
MTSPSDQTPAASDFVSRSGGGVSAVDAGTILERPRLAECLGKIDEHCPPPLTAYRLQFHKDFTFRAALELLPYLHKLGVTDCYSSPVLKARPGSLHGYDICDHSALNPELGTEADFDAFTDELKRLGMRLIMDFVPNHMGIDPKTNPWWKDVLENGPSSPHSRYFDIDWDPVKPELKNKILLPILGEPYGVVLERGELRLHYAEGAFYLTYFDNWLPLNPRQFPQILRPGLQRLSEILGEEHPHFVELLSIITELKNLPMDTETDRRRMAERRREKEVARARLDLLVKSSAAVRDHLTRAVETLNGKPGEPASFDLLHQLLETQTYRLASWRTASHEINYRRFFDINSLAGLRMENPDVFRDTHELLLRLIREGRVTGLRLDHPDGLYDPHAYFSGLQEAVRSSLLEELPEEEMAAVRVERPKPMYMAIEKILSEGESLAGSWAIHGTTGYDFLNEVNGIFIDADHIPRLQTLYERFVGHTPSWETIAYRAKKVIVSTTMASELKMLANELNRISEMNRRSRDFTLDNLRDALRELAACYPVYRTYIHSPVVETADRIIIDKAIRRAKRRNPAIDASIYDFIREVLIPEGAELPPDILRRRLEFTMKFQQYTGPVQAKGVEDTAFYRHNLLLSLNEVGGNPQRAGCSVAEFHEKNRSRAGRWPLAMLTTSTHDTKRGEDSRARLDVLSEMTEDWRRAVSDWFEINAGARTEEESEILPDKNDEYLFYQALLGGWTPREPIDQLVPRLQDYMNKAIREAKVYSSWIRPNETYEKAVADFIANVLRGPLSRNFLASFLPFAQRVAFFGMINSLAQLTLKMTCPGIPDFYQGSELWNFSFVDPDNRRPVDWLRRRRVLKEIEELFPSSRAPLDKNVLGQLMTSWQDGRLKLFVTAAGLCFRRDHAGVFRRGSYMPLEVEDMQSGHVVSFLRQMGGENVIVVVPRLAATLMIRNTNFPLGREVWGETAVILPQALAGRTWKQVLTRNLLKSREREGRWELPVAEILADFPVAILVSIENP